MKKKCRKEKALPAVFWDKTVFFALFLFWQGVGYRGLGLRGDFHIRRNLGAGRAGGGKLGDFRDNIHQLGQAIGFLVLEGQPHQRVMLGFSKGAFHGGFMETAGDAEDLLQFRRSGGSANLPD